MDQLNESTANKLNHLLTLLTEGKQELEILAEEIQDSGLRTLILAMADENFRSVKILQSLLSIREANIQRTGQPQIQWDSNTFNDFDSVFSSSIRIENIFVLAYRQVLNQWFPNETLRRALQFQLNGIKTGFMKLRLFTQLRKDEQFDLNLVKDRELSFETI